jgi:hypothetical protein
MVSPRRALSALLWSGLATAHVFGASEATLRADVDVLAGQIGPRSVLLSDTLSRAADHIVTRMEAAGWRVRRLPYLVNGATCENLEFERRGTLKPEEVVIVGAHYDTTSATPGADDNASGVAAMIALAEACARAQPQRTLRFVAFVNEEPVYFQTALMGSRVYAKGCKERGEMITAMLSLECVGYFSDEKRSQKYPFPLSLFYPSRGNFLAVVGNRESKSLVKRVTKSFRSSGALPCVSASLLSGLQGVGWSDHWSFWQEGYPAVMITDTAPFRNPHYHRASDVPATLDYARLGAGVRGLHAVIAELAGIE